MANQLEQNPQELLAILSCEWVCRYRIIPLKKTGGTLHVGLIDPTDQNTISAILFHTGLKIFPHAISESEWKAFLEIHCKASAATTLLTVAESKTTYQEPVIQYVDDLLKQALDKSASDIHIEPYENHCRIRFRQDGILYKVTDISNDLALRLVTRLKILANLDISERRLPQDGRLVLTHNAQTVDIRVNTCPTVSGEKIVLRILDSSKMTLTIDALGLNENQKKIFIDKISAPQGLILVAGPTGSGKTVTLYSALQFLNQVGKNISTVEDPVEIQLTGINQVNINPKIGLEFATVLRTFLRQDPDIIMVGEIRDVETAQIALQAAHTGHLVLSTIHTNNSVETLTRLYAMGIAPYHLANSLSLIVAQRLVRLLCNQCKKPDTLATTTAWRAEACAHCLQGYKGRTGIYELLSMTDTLAQLITTSSNPVAITTHLQQKEFISLLQVGHEKVTKGITSLSEIHRVLRT